MLYNIFPTELNFPIRSRYVFRWDTHFYMSLFPFVCPCVHCAPYLRNLTSSNHNFWYTCVKWWYLQAFLGGAPTSICHFFHLSICFPPYLRNCTSSNHNFWYTCVKWYLLAFFSFFFEILIFWAFRRVKGQK